MLINPPPTIPTDETIENDLDNDYETTPMDEQLVKSPDHEDILNSTGRILEQQPASDKIINTEVMIQNGNKMSMGKVARQSLDADGRIQGLTMTILSLTPSHMTWSSPMAKSRSMVPISSPRTCSLKSTQMATAYH